MSVDVLRPQPVVAPDERDMHGNLVMNLSSIGINNVVRFVRTEDGVRFAVIDAVQAFTGKDRNYSNQIIRRFPEEVITEINAKSISLQFKGPGQKQTTLITYEGVLKLIMALPGINAREMRTKFASVLQRYFAGDITLIEEIADNYVSPEPINNMAREALPQADTKEIRRKRRQETAEWNMQRKRKFLEAEDEVKVMKLIGVGKVQVLQLEHKVIHEHEISINELRQSHEDKMNKLLQAKVDIIREEIHAKKELYEINEKIQQQKQVQVQTAMEPPYTISRVAGFFGLLDGVSSVKVKEKILQLAGRLARTKYHLAPLAVKVQEAAYQVYQYHAESIEKLKEVIVEAAQINEKNPDMKTLESFWLPLQTSS